jgi:hypothetical protein
MYNVRTKSKPSQGLVVRILPSFLYLLLALAAGYGFFQGESLRYALPIFLIVTRFNFVIYAKYKLDNWALHVFHAILAMVVIFFMF